SAPAEPPPLHVVELRSPGAGAARPGVDGEGTGETGLLEDETEPEELRSPATAARGSSSATAPTEVEARAPAPPPAPRPASQPTPEREDRWLEYVRIDEDEAADPDPNAAAELVAAA